MSRFHEYLREEEENWLDSSLDSSLDWSSDEYQEYYEDFSPEYVAKTGDNEDDSNPPSDEERPLSPAHPPSPMPAKPPSPLPAPSHPSLDFPGDISSSGDFYRTERNNKGISDDFTDSMPDWDSIIKNSIIPSIGPDSPTAKLQELMRIQPRGVLPHFTFFQRKMGEGSSPPLSPSIRPPYLGCGQRAGCFCQGEFKSPACLALRRLSSTIEGGADALDSSQRYQDSLEGDSERTGPLMRLMDVNNPYRHEKKRAKWIEFPTSLFTLVIPGPPTDTPTRNHIDIELPMTPLNIEIPENSHLPELPASDLLQMPMGSMVDNLIGELKISTEGNETKSKTYSPTVYKPHEGYNPDDEDPVGPSGPC